MNVVLQPFWEDLLQIFGDCWLKNPVCMHINKVYMLAQFKSFAALQLQNPQVCKNKTTYAMYIQNIRRLYTSLHA